ncbi:MAG: hypothetical protein ACE5K4_07090 [Candidatus Hydrothermarchaeota archaeon]
MPRSLEIYPEIYKHLFRSKYTALALLALIENDGRLERPRLRELVDCRDFNKYVMVPLIDMGFIEVDQDRTKYPYRTYVNLTEKGKIVAENVKRFVYEINEVKLPEILD